MNLCDTCLYERDSCEGFSKPIVQDGDDVTECQSYTPVDVPDISPAELPEAAAEKYYTPPDLGTCMACHLPLKEIPVNSRVKSVVCNNPKCTLFRTRIQLYSEKLPEASPMYYCTHCKGKHMIDSEIGKRHSKYMRG